MKQLTIESHYLGSIEYYTLLSYVDNVVIPEIDVFRKQTYRNRCYLLSANGVLPLIVPVNYSRSMQTRDVTVDQNQRWKKDHWGAIYSAYGKAPFFDYFIEDFHMIIYQDHKFLLDLNRNLLDLTLKLLQLDVNVTYTLQSIDHFGENFVNAITPKKSFVDRKIYSPVAYSQLFGKEFSPNMSILDLLMCEGPRSKEVLTASFLKGKEQS